MKKDNRNILLNIVMMTVLLAFFTAQAYVQGGSPDDPQTEQLTPIEQATHIIHGTVLGPKRDSSGHLISPAARVRVDEVLKDLDNSISEGSIISINAKVNCDEFRDIFELEREGRETIIFEEGEEVILPLKRRGLIYALFKSDKPFAIGIVDSGHVYNYDPALIGRLEREGKKENIFLRQQNRAWKEKSPKIENEIRWSVMSDIILRKQWASKSNSELSSVQNYLQLVRGKVGTSDLSVARQTSHVVLARVVDKKNIVSEQMWPHEWIEITLKKEKDIKGKTKQSTWKRLFPAGNSIGNGIPVPEIQTRGIYLLIDSPCFFIPLDSNNNLISGKNRKNAMTFAEFKTLLLKGN